MRWIPAHDDAILPEETAGAPAAGFRQICRCGATFLSVRLVLPACLRCGREGADAWVKVVAMMRGYPSIELIPDPQLLATLQEGKRSSWGRRAWRDRARAWIRSWVKLIQHPRHA